MAFPQKLGRKTNSIDCLILLVRAVASDGTRLLDDYKYLLREHKLVTHHVIERPRITVVSVRVAVGRFAITAKSAPSDTAFLRWSQKA